MIKATLMMLALVAVGCGAGQKDIEVKGQESEAAKLAGDWEGDYTGNESGRTGTIKFSLQLGRHTAEGQVFMGGSDTPLKVEFVDVENGQIKGTIAPYTDPNCNCQVDTSFIGTINGDQISGMFETKISANSQIQTGTWQVTRKAP